MESLKINLGAVKEDGRESLRQFDNDRIGPESNKIWGGG